MDLLVSLLCDHHWWSTIAIDHSSLPDERNPRWVIDDQWSTTNDHWSLIKHHRQWLDSNSPLVINDPSRLSVVLSLIIFLIDFNWNPVSQKSENPSMWTHVLASVRKQLPAKYKCFAKTRKRLCEHRTHTHTHLSLTEECKQNKTVSFLLVGILLQGLRSCNHVFSQFIFWLEGAMHRTYWLNIRGLPLREVTNHNAGSFGVGSHQRTIHTNESNYV